MKKSLENLLAQQGIALLNTLSKEERRTRTETIKARYREAGYDDLPHELVTFLTIFDDKDIKRRDGYMVFIYSQNLAKRCYTMNRMQVLPSLFPLAMSMPMKFSV
ncbi:hypothetical protein SAMN05444420_103147 [Capnocytophaga granulosa]|uniref:Uncharacterized protein n=1 Tax=Capnocytophaga granulosa TaxID=45242 RepID=A0A1H2VDC7_9FLAO|nr:hypothetical protein [Capnocytophaga granulosa]SDW66333.1 hypothetical protein SAMN05444420_103147 [Capnocytophaga granulosa]SUX17684.1 Uncharacterised protein [Capnocytophaga granulosa]